MESRSTALNIKWRCNVLMPSKHSEQRLHILQWSREGSMMLSAKRSGAQRMRKSCMEIADFGGCHWQPQRVGSTLGEETGAISQSEVCGFRDGKPTMMSVTSLAMPLRQLMPNVTVVF